MADMPIETFVETHWESIDAFSLEKALMITSARHAANLKCLHEMSDRMRESVPEYVDMVEREQAWRTRLKNRIAELG